MRVSHALEALVAVCSRELRRFVQQRGRLLAALVRPTLWLLVFAAGFQNVFGVSIIPPYQSYITYQVYIIPGLLAMVLLFNGMQSSLGMVYDREMGTMRLLLTAPLPRWYLLGCKLIAGVMLSLAQAYAFYLIAVLSGIELPPLGGLTVLPALMLAACMLGALGLLLSVAIRQLENFAGAMNFVIFPLFFLSSALYPLWKLEESGAWLVYWLASYNPFGSAVELIRFALYGQWHLQATAAVAIVTVVCFALAVLGYDPQQGLIRRIRRG